MIAWLVRRSAGAAFLGAAVLLLCRLPAAAATPDGAALFRAHCASCHGEGGTGDGPDASLFSPPPAKLSKDFLQRYSLEALVRRVREGTPLDLQMNVQALRRRATDVEDLADYLRRLPDIDWRRAERGEEIYIERCESCHGRFGHSLAALPAGVRQPRDLSSAEVRQSLAGEALEVAVRHGREHMPALTPRVAARDVPPLVAFVSLLSPGYEKYTRYCSSCHGDDGRGGHLPVDGLRLPQVTFNRAYFSRTDPEVLRSRIWHMAKEEKPAMPHYRERLTPEEAAAIVEWLRR